MRIAIVHSFYSSDTPSGENTVVLQQVDALTEAGHDVALIARHTDDDRRQSLYSLRSAARVITGRGPDPTPELTVFRPDVVHVHNLFPNFSTRWLRTWEGPVVATLHNFRPICANGLLFRDGHYCEECPTQSNSAAIRNACYHGSRIASIPLSLRNARGPAADDVLARADALVCLSDQAADIYRRLTRLDLPLVVIPNGIDVPRADPAAPSNGRWLVVSRLSPEKGVRELVEAWPDDQSLDIIGDGPERQAIAAVAHPMVALLGAKSREQILDAMPGYAALVFPSRCLEMQPTVLAEALGSGLPIAALTHSAAAPFVEIDAARAYRDRVDLPSALDDIRRDRPLLSAGARAAYEAAYTREAWVDRLTTLYASLGSVAR